VVSASWSELFDPIILPPTSGKNSSWPSSEVWTEFSVYKTLIKVTVLGWFWRNSGRVWINYFSLLSPITYKWFDRVEWINTTRILKFCMCPKIREEEKLMRLLYISWFSVHTFTYCYRLGSCLNYKINTMLINHKHHSIVDFNMCVCYCIWQLFWFWIDDERSHGCW
jgi:hypothetical protein